MVDYETLMDGRDLGWATLRSGGWVFPETENMYCQSCSKGTDTGVERKRGWHRGAEERGYWRHEFPRREGMLEVCLAPVVGGDSRESGTVRPPTRGQEIGMGESNDLIRLGSSEGIERVLSRGDVSTELVIGYVLSVLLHRVACGILVPQSRMETVPLLWKLRILTTGSPGNSHWVCSESCFQCTSLAYLLLDLSLSIPYLLLLL